MGGWGEEAQAEAEGACLHGASILIGNYWSVVLAFQVFVVFLPVLPGVSSLCMCWCAAGAGKG